MTTKTDEQPITAEEIEAALAPAILAERERKREASAKAALDASAKAEAVETGARAASYRDQYEDARTEMLDMMAMFAERVELLAGLRAKILAARSHCRPFGIEVAVPEPEDVRQARDPKVRDAHISFHKAALAARRV